MASTKKTGNETVADSDPGGTHPTRGKSDQPGSDKTEHHVQTGDRNVRPDPDTKPNL